MTDVCLLLEGTFPYVSGGVSSWVYELISSLDDLTFSIVYLGANSSSTRKKHYDMPGNVVDFYEHYLFDYQIRREHRHNKKRSHYKIVGEFLKRMRLGDTSFFGNVARLVGDEKERVLDLYDIFYSYEGWQMLMDMYSNESMEISFIDYFWTWRYIYLPFFSVLRMPLPLAKVYHTISTGYAGLLGSLCKRQFNMPLILTEHGIYTRERKIEIAQADWICPSGTREDEDFFKSWWTSLFTFFSHVTYENADEIITLYEGNRGIEIEEGAPSEKTRIIPNGIDFDVFSRLCKEPKNNKFRIGFMGRIVPIKDVKTFIRACKIIYKNIRDIEIYIMGPTDEDRQYYYECVRLVKREAMSGIIKFMGEVDPKEYYPKLDVLVLTSISESQPIVILEASACGIPVVATDVGSCSELLYGMAYQDRLLGKSGIITQIFNPQATADAVIQILKNFALSARMGETGRKRIYQYYRRDDVMRNYQKLYTQYMEKEK